MNAQSNYTLQTMKDKNGNSFVALPNDPYGVRVYTLNNGLKVILAKNNDEPRIQTYIPVRTGSTNDPADNTGLAHYLEHMMFKGTSKIGTKNWEAEKTLLKQIADLYEQHKAEKDPSKKKEIYKKIDALSQEAANYAVANEYDKLITALGAKGTNAHTWHEETVYKNNIPSNELEKWLMIEQERFGELVLRIFHTELETVYEEFNRAQDNDFRLVNYTMMKHLFPTHNYGQQTTIGEPEHLKNPSMYAIHNYFDTYYVPNNMAIVLVGDLDYDTTIELVKKYFGNYKSKPLPPKKIQTEKPLDKIIRLEVSSPSAENFVMAYRTPGIKSKEAKYLQLIDYILSNSTAGLLDLHINQAKKAQRVSSDVTFFNDYGVHQLSGVPKEGQTVDEVKDLILKEIEKIKKGDFDDWLLEAIIRDMKMQKMRYWESADGLATELYRAYLADISWDEVMNEIDEMAKITKQDLMQFAKDFYQDNYVFVHKKQGVNDQLVRIEKPEITPIKIDRDAASEFYKSIQKVKSPEIKPEFVDFKKAIKTQKLKSGVTYHHIPNTTHQISSVTFIFPVGQDHDNTLSYAFAYWDLVGTKRFSPSDLKKELYKYGVSVNASVSNDETTVTITSLDGDLSKAFALLKEYMFEAKPEAQAFEDFIKGEIKRRKDNKKNKNYLSNALVQYARYGKNSRFLNFPSIDELKSIGPEGLLKKVASLAQYPYEVFFYGKNEQVVLDAINKDFPKPTVKKLPIAKVFPEPETDGKVYLLPYDMVQVELGKHAKGELYSPNRVADALIFNDYFGSGLSSIVFQEIRESKALAYSAYSIYRTAPRLGESDYTQSFIGTQTDKLSQALESLDALLDNMPLSEVQFKNALDTSIKKLQSERIRKANIFWSARSMKKRGFDGDMRKQVYERLLTYKMDDLKKFFDSHIKGKKFNTTLLGKKENFPQDLIKSLGEVVELTPEMVAGEL